MRTTRFLIATVKETPADAEIISHQLMLRAGFIRKIAAGLYTWLPLGLRVLRKIEHIVRTEMNRAGAQEVLMPTVQPAELWQETGRWDVFGAELLRFKDRHERDFCLGPTHEEIITDIVRREIRSYKQLPVNFYQIQTKFRDEIRPRFGVMRSREFIMKDAYSFDLTQEGLQASYDAMYHAYCAIFDRLGLRYRVVEADSGAIGGSRSQEFHVLADSGEDAIAYCAESQYAANVETVRLPAPATPRPAYTSTTYSAVKTPHQHTIAEVSAFLKVSPIQCVKTLIVKGQEGGLVALVLRGDHSLNAIKASQLPNVFNPLTFASPEQIKQQIGCEIGSLGVIGLNIPFFVDYAAAQLVDFICGANKDGEHFINVNWGRDLPEPIAVDLRNAEAGDPSPDGQGILSIERGIEVGHIFQLGTKYSQAMDTKVLDEEGKATTLIMGCYGIGVTRLVAAAIEQNYDENGIIWTDSIAPFSVAFVPMNYHRSERVKDAAEDLYTRLQAAGVDVLMDDRKDRAGVLFADMDLLGIPHRLVLGERGLDEGYIEYKHRREKSAQNVPLQDVIAFIQAKLA